MIEIYHPLTGRTEKKILSKEEELLYNVFKDTKRPDELTGQLLETSGWSRWLDGEMNEETLKNLITYFIGAAEEQIREVFRRAGVKLEDVEEEMLHMRQEREGEEG